MASQIDPTKPTAIRAYTADERNNFAIAASEITALQGSTTEVVNVRAYGADPTGMKDSTAAINAAAATKVLGMYRNVYLPSGNYAVSDALNIGNGQTIFGDGRGLTNINVTSTFNPAALGVIVLNGREFLAPVVRDLSITFTQPPDVSTTATAASSAGSTTITVASAANILIGGSVTDVTHPAIPAGVPGMTVPLHTTVVSVVGNVVTLSSAIVSPGVSVGDTIRFNASRATFLTLAGGATVGLGGTGCKYPPAIYVDAANRFKIRDVRIANAWDGISAGAVNTIGGYFIENIEVGAFNIGLFLDQGFDFGHLARFHSWNFGMIGNLFLVYMDGQTKAAEFGAAQALAVDDFATFGGYVHINANAAHGWFHFNKLQLDQTQINVDDAAFLQIDTFYVIRARPGTAVLNDILVSGGHVQIGNLYCTTNVTAPHVAVTGGSLSIHGGLLGTQFAGFSSLATVTNGSLELDNLTLGASSGTNALIQQIGSAGTLIVNNCQFPTSVTGVAIAIETDSINHSIQGNNFNRWTFTPPGILGSYSNPVYNGTVSSNAMQSTGLLLINPEANGANIIMIGNGDVTPRKFIRSWNGELQIVNSAFGAQILALTDDGILTCLGAVQAPSIRISRTVGPTWTGGFGPPTTTEPEGSIYSNMITPGTTGARLYVSAGNGSWNAVADV